MLRFSKKTKQKERLTEEADTSKEKKKEGLTKIPEEVTYEKKTMEPHKEKAKAEEYREVHKEEVEGVKPKDSQKILKKRKFKPTPWWKDIVLGVINLGFIALLVIFSGRLPQRANELREARRENLKNIAKTGIEIAGLEIEYSRQKADKLNKLFPDEKGVIDFVREIDTLKEEGIISSFSFASENYVRDRTGYFGIPFVVGFDGTWSLIGEGLQRFQDLPFIFRAVSIETERQPEGNIVKLRYGGFLYVNESLAKD